MTESNEYKIEIKTEDKTGFYTYLGRQSICQKLVWCREYIDSLNEMFSVL